MRICAVWNAGIVNGTDMTITSDNPAYVAQNYETSSVADSYALAITRSSATSTTVMLTNNTGTTASVRYVLAAYTADGRMVTCTSSTSSMPDGESLDLTVSYSVNVDVAGVQAFVLQPSTMIPLRELWSSELVI